ncbi:MAG: hypothetical protein U9M97_03685 [Candidatus Hadarchaeota archaeon]|nr:hypothetical protein [Candidatus Hadarchaeota archaeon]
MASLVAGMEGTTFGRLVDTWMELPGPLLNTNHSSVYFLNTQTMAINQIELVLTVDGEVLVY